MVLKILVTGGSGFIGSAFIRFLIGETDAEIVNVDKLTYAATPGALADVETDRRYAFAKVDIRDGAAPGRHRRTSLSPLVEYRVHGGPRR